MEKFQDVEPDYQESFWCAINLLVDVDQTPDSESNLEAKDQDGESH